MLTYIIGWLNDNLLGGHRVGEEEGVLLEADHEAGCGLGHRGRAQVRPRKAKIT